MKNKEMKSQNISEVRVVTFDLDNTIWKTGAVISSANDALAEYLDSKGIFYENENRVEKVMGKIFQKDKGKYCPVLAEDIRNGIGEEYSWDNVKAPVLLTQLRIDAVMEILRNQTTEFEDELEDFAKEAFQVWTNARHAAIPSNLASSVLESLKRIRQLKTKDGKDVVVGAVTDGNSNPLKIDLLKEYFDFVVNAEIVGISKPDRRIYDAAISHVASNPKLKHVFNGCDTNNVDALMDMNLDWWVHIGDDFVKDIVASKDLRMRSIWCRELIMDKLAKEETKPEPKTNLEEFRKTVADQKMLTMSIGTDDYLTTTLHNEFADAIVDDFCNVAAVVLSWHEEGTQLASTQNIVNETDLPDYFSIVTPDDKPVNESAPEAKIGGRDEKANSKFCVECGENLPRAAKVRYVNLCFY
jgi:FMN phosphatase YigB (HAD superfamily)